ncbi:MAG: hypothetical protein ACFFB5_01015 [Promethearchaeota archaeon]
MSILRARYSFYPRRKNLEFSPREIPTKEYGWREGSITEGTQVFLLILLIRGTFGLNGKQGQDIETEGNEKQLFGVFGYT